MKAEETAILDILWLLMLHFCICDCELEPEEKCLAYGKLWLMDWIVEMMPECKLNPEKDELQSVFANNHNLANLIDKVCPDSVSRSKPDKPLLNLTYALMFAEDKLSMSQSIVKANEIIDGVCPDYALVIYLALLKRKYDILNHSDSSTSQFGRRNNLFSDKEIILEERSKEEILEGVEQSNMDEELDDGDDDERDRTGVLELKSKSFHEDLSERLVNSMANEASHADNEEDDEDDDFVLIDSEKTDKKSSKTDVTSNVGDNKDPIRINNDVTDSHKVQTGSSDLQTMVNIKTPTPERTEHSEKMLTKGSIESVSVGNKSFEPFSDSAAVDVQTDIAVPLKHEGKTSLSDVGEDEVIFIATNQSRDLEEAAVEVFTNLNAAAQPSKLVGDTATVSEKPGPGSFSTRLSSERETIPFSTNDAVSSTKHSEVNLKVQPLTNTELTHVSSNKAIDTSDEDIGTLKSEATSSKVPEVGRGLPLMKKFTNRDELKEVTNESNESIGPVGLSEKSARKLPSQHESKSSSGPVQITRSNLSVESGILNADSPELSAITPGSESKKLSGTARSNQAGFGGGEGEAVNGKYAALPGRPLKLALTEKEFPKIKRSSSPPSGSEHGTPGHRSHTKTTYTTPIIGTENGSTPRELEPDPVSKKPSIGNSKPDAPSSRSSRRGSFDSVSSESIFPGGSNQEPEFFNQGSVNVSLTRESAHGTPVHMIGVRASPSNDPLYQLLDKISKRGESLKLAMNETHTQTQTQTVQDDGEDLTRMEALNGIVTNLETQIEILGSENERLKSEIQRIHISKMQSPRYDDTSVSLNAQVQFLDEELEKYKSENENLKIQMDELRSQFVRQEHMLRSRVKPRSGNSQLNGASKVVSHLEPLLEGSHESLDKSVGSSKRTPRASVNEDAVIAKEAEIARLTLELEDVLETNDIVVEELERVKTLFTRSQIEEIRANLDAEIEKARRGDSEHPQQTLEELAITIQKLEDSVAAQNNSCRTSHGVSVDHTGTPQHRRLAHTGGPASSDTANTRMRRKFISDAGTQLYTGRVDHSQRQSETQDEDVLHRASSSFTPVGLGTSVDEIHSVSPHPRERSGSGPPHLMRPHKSALVRPVATSATASLQTADLRRSTVSLPAVFSSENTPRSLSKESLKQSNQQFDAQVQTNLSVSSQFEPSKLSMSTQTNANVANQNLNQVDIHPQIGFTAPYPYGADLTGKLPAQAFPNMATQTPNQVEGAIEKLSYDALRSYTKNLSIDAVQGDSTVPNSYPPPSAFNQGQQWETEPVNLKPEPVKTHENNTGIFFYDGNMVLSSSAQANDNAPHKTDSFGVFENAVRAEAQTTIPKGQNFDQGYSFNQSVFYPPSITTVSSSQQFGPVAHSNQNQSLPYDLRNTIATIVQDEVQRSKDEQFRSENLILNELALRCAQRTRPVQPAYELNARSDYVPPLEELIMNRYKKDPNWKVPPSNIEELLSDYGSKRPVHYERRSVYSPVEHGFYTTSDIHSKYAYRERNREIERNFGGDMNYGSAPVFNEHESDDIYTERERRPKSGFSFATRERGHRERVCRSPIAERERYNSSSLNKSNLSPYEFVNSVPIKLNFKRPPLVWGRSSQL